MLEQLNQVVADQMEPWAVPGISIGLLRDGEIESTTHGIASIATDQPVTPETLFQIGSISNVFTTTLLMTFVDEGVIDLDAPNAITLRHPDGSVRFLRFGGRLGYPQ